MTALEQFAQLATRRRIARGMSVHEVAGAAVISQSQVHHLLNHHKPIGPKLIHRLCAVLGIPDPDAWTLAIHGRLPGPVTLEQAQRILDLIGHASEPQRIPLRSAIAPRYECRVCGCKWKGQATLKRLPKSCPNCQSEHWCEGLDARAMATRLKRSASMKAKWAGRRRVAA